MIIVDLELCLAFIIYSIRIVQIIAVDSDGNAEVLRDLDIEFEVVDLLSDEDHLALCGYVDDSNYALAA